MRILRVLRQGKTFYASLQDRELICLDKSLGITSPLALTEVRVLPPVAPSKVVGVVLNSRSLAKQQDMEPPRHPELFLKPPSALISPGDSVVLPAGVGQVMLEGQLALVMGRTARRIAVQDVPEHLFGYACAADITAWDYAMHQGGLTGAKAFDTFLPLGPWIETEAPDLAELKISVLLNSQPVAEATLEELILTPWELVAAVSRIMTLNPGDVVLCGATPARCWIAAGQEARVDIAGVGLLINPVMSDPGLVQ